MQPLTFAEAIDLELQLEQDKSLDFEVLRDRDRTIGLSFKGASHNRLDMIRAWLRSVSQQSDPGPTVGQRIGGMIKTAKPMVWILGIVIGALSAQGVISLAKTGAAGVSSTPLNLLNLLMALVLAQVLLLFLATIGLLMRRARPGNTSSSPFVPALADFFMFKKFNLKNIYPGLMKWILVGLVQRFAVAFNIGVMVAFFYFVAFTELTFGWATTFQSSPAWFYQLIQILAAPWDLLGAPFGGSFDGFVPTLELVTNSQFSPFAGVFVIPDATGRDNGLWWRFLMMSMFVYGLSPRIILLLYARKQERKALKAINLNSVAADNVLRRLKTPFHSWDADQVIVNQDHHHGLFEQSFGSECAVVLWRDIPFEDEGISQIVLEKFHYKVALIVSAGGHAQDLDGEMAFQEIELVLKESTAPILVVCDPFEPPGKAIKRFLKGLRERLKETRPIFVVPIDPETSCSFGAAEKNINVWRSQIDQMRDPFTGVASV